MFSLSLNFPKFAAAGAIIALIVSGGPARADETAQNSAEAVADTASGQQASLVGSNARDDSAAGQAMERKTDGIKCVRQMPRYRPAPDFVFKC